MFAISRIHIYLATLALAGLPLVYGQALAQADEPQAEDSSDSRRIERLGEVSTDEWEMDLALPVPASDAPADSADLALPDAARNQELQRLLSDLARNPGNKVAQRALDAFLAEALAEANSMLDAGAYGEAEQTLQALQSVDPGLKGLGRAQDRLEALGEVGKLLAAGGEALAAGRIMEPADDNARSYYQRVLDLEPDNAAAAEGLASVQAALVGMALQSAQAFDFETAEARLLEATTAHTELEPVEDAREQVDAIRQGHAAELERHAIEAMDAGFFDQADMHIIDLIALGGQQDKVDALRARLSEARLYGGLVPGQIIRDPLLTAGGAAPDLVIVRAGSFRMGSGRHAESEQPRHRVTIARGFALGVTEVTVGDFARFVDNTAYRTSAEKAGRSSIYNEAAGRLNEQSGVNWRHDYQGKQARPELPVLHVSQRDANAYAQWLAQETGKAYRLPSEAEYEYVARAGGAGDYWWGEGAPAAAVENLTGERDVSSSGRQWTVHFDKYEDGYWGPAPAGSLVDGALAHPMGVHDIAGNVSEWVADCWHQNYVKAPADGSAWVNPGCSRGVVRGCNWASAPEQCRASARIPFNADKFGSVIGFRIARDL